MNIPTQTIQAPRETSNLVSNAFRNVVCKMDETVEWIMQHSSDGSFVVGYKIKKAR